MSRRRNPASGWTWWAIAIPGCCFFCCLGIVLAVVAVAVCILHRFHPF